MPAAANGTNASVALNAVPYGGRSSTEKHVWSRLTPYPLVTWDAPLLLPTVPLSEGDFRGVNGLLVGRSTIDIRRVLHRRWRPLRGPGGSIPPPFVELTVASA